MPLPPSTAPRQRAHVRRLELEGFVREDGLLEIEASLTDVKDIDYPLESGMRAAGEPIHLLRVRVTVDAAFNIVDAVACSDAVPYPGFCDTIGPAYRRLIGLNLVRGFRSQVGEMFGDVRGSGLMIGIELVRDKEKTPANEEAGKIRAAMRQKGFLIGVGGTYGNVLRFQPPLVISSEELSAAVAALAESLKAL